MWVWGPETMTSQSEGIGPHLLNERHNNTVYTHIPGMVTGYDGGYKNNKTV